MAAPTDNPPAAEWRMFIDGALVPASSGAVFDNIDPTTEAVIGVTADGTDGDFSRAVAAARRAFDETDWATNATFRAHCLRQLHDVLQAEKEIVRPLLVSEVGTCIWLTRDTLFDVPIDRLADYARLAETYAYERPLSDVDFRGSVSHRRLRREPVGVVSVIIPWNGPWGSGLGKIGAALAAGNTIIAKPAPDAPWAMTILGAAAARTDLPPGVLNIVTAQDNLKGEILTTDPRVDMVAFTGSAPNGRRVAEAGAQTMKRMLLELGGKSAYIVLPSADVAQQAAIAGKMICGNAGQGCVARSRLLVPRDRYEEAIAAAKAAMDAVTIGDPRDPAHFMGPLVSRIHRERVLAHIERAKAAGNRLVRGGGIPAHLPTGFFVEPTLFADVLPDDGLAQDEVFGPVLAVIAYDDVDDAVRIANNSIYGLSATVAAATDAEAIAVADRLRTGTVSINGGVWMHMDVPFGGFKQSGIGRQFGLEGFETFLEIKVYGIPSSEKATSLAWGEA